MKNSLNKVIEIQLFLYILSLYLFTYQPGLNMLSNLLALSLVFSILIWNFFKRNKFIVNKYLILYLIFIFICLISTLYSIDKNIALSKVITLGLIFILMFTLINYIKTFKKAENVILYFILSGAIASVYLLLNSNLGQWERLGGELGNVNAIGMIITISFVFAINKVIFEKKYIFLIYTLPMIPVILLTGSRKSLIFMIFSLVLILLYTHRKGLKSKLKLLSIVAALSFLTYYIVFKIPLFYNIIGNRIRNLFEFFTPQGNTEGSLNVRSYMIQFGIDSFKERPLLGYGIDNYRVLFKKDHATLSYAHNNYIELLVDLGLLGLVLYMVIQLYILVKLFFNMKEKKAVSLTLPILIILISYLILGNSLVYYDSKHFSIIIMLGSIISHSNFRATIEKQQ